MTSASSVQTITSAPTRSKVILGLVFAFSAALSYGTSQVLARQGVSDLAPPLIGSLIALFWGTVGFCFIALRSLGGGVGNLRRGAPLFAGGGLFSATGVILLFQALNRGQVVVISPIAATNSLFTLVLVALLLRGVEKITLRTAAGALLVVAGVVVLTVG